MAAKTNKGNSIQNLNKTSRDNNFSMIRMIATVFVFVGHMGMIINGNAPTLGGFRLHELGVSILFLLSGYLITMSWLSDSHPLRYAIRRFFRLWPPFTVMILLMAFVAGPLVSELGVNGYFQSGGYRTFLLNLRFLIVYSLPGVFTNMTVANTVNGSLWTMPVEAALYVVTPVLATVLRMRRRSKVSFFLTVVLTVAACLFDLYLRVAYAGTQVVFYATDWVSAFHLITLYVIGTLFTYDQMKKHLNLEIASVAMCALLVFQFSASIFQYAILYLILPYFIFSLAFAPKATFRNFCRKLEPSYGIYLYGFFFEQLVVYLLQKNGIAFTYTQALFLSAVPTFVAAVLSYYLVEKPSQKLGRYLVGKLRRKN